MRARRDNVRGVSGIKSYKSNKDKLKFHYRKIRFLSLKLRRMLFSAVNQLNFDYACPAVYPNRTEKKENKEQIMQNKCIRFCKDWPKCIIYLKSILD